MDHSSPNNSGSMQSSSGGGDDQDYDSRNESISPLFNSISNNNHPYPPQPTLFDPPPQLQLQDRHLGHQFSHDPPAAADQLDLVWSYSTLGYNLTPLSSSTSSSFPPSTQSQLGLSTLTDQAPNLIQSLDGRNSPRVAPNSVSDHKISQTTTNVGKSSRKRTRASRRAPTTVISTDASNFRHMVQEFTGIPAPPPFSSSPYGRGRLDLFGGSNPRSGHLDALGPIYPFRPSAQKVQQNPLVSSTSSSSLLNSTTIPASTSNSNGAHTFPSNYQMNMQNPVLNSTFQSLLHSNGSHLETKSQGSLGIVSMDRELGVGQQHGTVSATSLGEFSLMQVGGSNNNNLTRSIWRGKEGTNDDEDRRLGSFNGSNGVPQHGIGNSSGSGSDFVTEKRMENLSSRNEGMVDSWICPSD